MRRTTLSQYKENLNSQIAEIESLIERRKATPEDRQRLLDIERQLDVFAMVEKPDSMTKKLKMEENR